MASWKLIEHENDPLFVFLKFKSIQHFAKVQGRSFTCSLNIILILIKNYTMKFRKWPKMALQEIDHVFGLHTNVKLTNLFPANGTGHFFT